MELGAAIGNHIMWVECLLMT